MKNNQSGEKRDNKASPKPIPVTNEGMSSKNEKAKKAIKDTKAQ